MKKEEIRNISLYIDGNLIQEEISSPINFLLINNQEILDIGNHNASCITEDIFGVLDINTSYFTIDLVPNIEITNPENNYSTTLNVSYVNYTYPDYFGGVCWYSNNDEENSTSWIGNNNFFMPNSKIGLNEITLYCNNTFGNISFDKINYTLEPIRFNQSYKSGLVIY